MTTTIDLARDILIAAANNIVASDSDTDAKMLAYAVILEAISALDESVVR